MNAARSLRLLALLLVPLSSSCSHATTAQGPATASAVTVNAPATPVELSPYPNAVEAAFVKAVSADVSRRFPTAQSALAAGYIRYTEEDKAGIITYTNLHWFADDPAHPTQLWYDTAGHLIGTDFTAPVRDRAQRPHLWGLQPGRWVHFIAHIHYIVRGANGAPRYGSMMNQAFAANGGDPSHPKPQALVRAGIVKNAGDVRLMFILPQLWIASFWTIPNPNGAFADLNANVKVTKGARPAAHPL